MNQLYHGCKVSYNGYKTDEKGSTVDAVRYSTVIGWDENTVYTDFILAEGTGGECYYYEPEIIEPHMVRKDFRIGFHRTRLIKVVEEVKINVNSQLLQAQLF